MFTLRLTRPLCDFRLDGGADTRAQLKHAKSEAKRLGVCEFRVENPTGELMIHGHVKQPLKLIN